MNANNFYFNHILGEDANSFLSKFQSIWTAHLDTFPQKYRTGRQFITGARFRPVLVCWGFTLAGNELSEERKDAISQLALHIELLHKATLLIDDLIDEDISRHGEMSFHTEFSDHEAILFAIYLLGDSLGQLCKALGDTISKKEYFEILELFSETIKEMTLGALIEVNMENNQLTSVKLIEKIIEHQTISIIKNGLLIGYKYGGGKVEWSDTIEKIGYDCGYIFQLLNDLEPFASFTLNAHHKGVGNIDIIRSRKNIVIALLFNQLEKKEKDLFQRFFNSDEYSDNEISMVMHKLYIKYEVLGLMLDKLNQAMKNVRENIDLLLENGVNQSLIHDFKKFVNFVLLEAINRTGPNDKEKLLGVLTL